MIIHQIFLDTLHHFPETLALAQTASDNYLAPLHTYTPPLVSSASEFSAKYGDRLWETDEASYDYLVKVEPAARAYEELEVHAVITGRRRSQGAEREGLAVIEVDERGLIKVNPLIGWTFKQVKEYVDKEYAVALFFTVDARRRLISLAEVFPIILCLIRGIGQSETSIRQLRRIRPSLVQTRRNVVAVGKGRRRANVGCIRIIGT